MTHKPSDSAQRWTAIAGRQEGGCGIIRSARSAYANRRRRGCTARRRPCAEHGIQSGISPRAGDDTRLAPGPGVEQDPLDARGGSARGAARCDSRRANDTSDEQCDGNK